MFNLYFSFIQKIKRSIFPFFKDRELKTIFAKLQEGYPKEQPVARFVGGSVRKYLSGEKIDDIDVATTLTIKQIKEKLKGSEFKIIDTGVEHGSVTIVSKNHKIEITTLRQDIKTDGRHAEIKKTDNWLLDSERRDFTINSIYLDINGKIFDPQMGSVDLKNNNVKFIGDPQKRIEEDYLRIIRFIRFKIIYDIKVETTTSNAIKQNLDGIKKISKERILIELLKILELKNFLKINENENLKEIFSKIFPEFIYLDRLERLKKIYKHSKLNKEIILSILLIDGKDNHEYFFHKYNPSNKIQDKIKKIANNLNEIKKDKFFFDKELLKNIYYNGKDHLIALNIINFSMNSKIQFTDFLKTLERILKSNVPNFPFNGEYLKKNGMREGEAIGKVLKTAEMEWVKNNFSISSDRVRELIHNYSN